MFRFEMRYKVRYKLPLLQLHFKGGKGNIQVLRFTMREVCNQIITKKKTTSLSLSDSLLYDNNGRIINSLFL